MAGQIFISYSSVDREYVDRLASFLRSQGLNVWYDPEIRPGERYSKVIEQAIATSVVLIVLMTPDADASEWVEREIEHAENKGTPVLPVLLAGEPFFRYSTRQWTDVRDGQLPPQSFVDELRQLTLGDATVVRPSSTPRAAQGVRPVAVHVQATAPPPALRPARRGRKVTAGLVAMVVLITVGAAVWWVTEGRPDSTGPTPTPQTTTRVAQTTAQTTTRPVPSTNTPQGIRALDRFSPGCRESDPAVIWTVVDASLVCNTNGTVLSRKSTWRSDADDGYAELRLTFKDQEIPTKYTVSFVIANMSDPGGTANHLGCGALLAHATADGTTFDVAAVCGTGNLAIARFAGDRAVGRVDDEIPTGVSPGTSGTYKVTVSVSSTAVVLMVDNTHGATKTLTLPPVGTATAYIGLAVVWHDAGAQATFSDLHYNIAV